MKNDRSWVLISAAAFKQNIASLSRLIGTTQLGVVVKANAYGHGLIEIGKLCQETDAVSWLFTAGLQEAVALRSSGVTKPILVLAYLDGDLQDVITYDITCSVADSTTAHELAAYAQALNARIAVHLKIDTGMSRFGLQPDALFEQQLREIVHLSSLTVTGIFTHLSDTNNTDYSFTHEQLMRFEGAVTCAENIFGRRLYRHALASGALHLPERYDCVRVGSNAYGHWKSPLQQQRVAALDPQASLKPILTWKTRVIGVKVLNPGDAVGYHRTYIATTPTKIAILPVGYYDGYPRNLSHKARVYIRQQYAPVVGIISMNSMVVDVSHIGSARVGDEVILCGDIPGIGAHELAVMGDSIQNEFLARILPTIPRIII